MNACTAASAIQLLGAALTFLLTVVLLEISVGRQSPKICVTAILPPRSGRRSWLNAFVALGAVARGDLAPVLGELPAPPEQFRPHSHSDLHERQRHCDCQQGA